MEERDAQEIVRMVESAWRVDYGPEGRRLWREMLLPHDAEIATKAAAQLSQRQRERPTIADLRQVILSLRRQQIDENAWRGLPPEKHEKPAWVKRWEKARDVSDFRIFPEQIPGYLDLQKDEKNTVAYALPSSPQDDVSDWVQSGEYA